MFMDQLNNSYMLLRSARELKTKKYEETAKQHDAKFVPFIMEATGGMSKSAKQIYEMIILASRDNGTLWPHDIIARARTSNSHRQCSAAAAAAAAKLQARCE